MVVGADSWTKGTKLFVCYLFGGNHSTPFKFNRPPILHLTLPRLHYIISLAILTIGITTLLGSDDLLAAFSCGVAFAWDGFFNQQTEESVFSSVIDILFNIAAFIFVGAWMPFDKFDDKLLTLEVWRLVVIAILVLILRRLPIMIALYKWIPDIKTFRGVVFSGHFGPIGIGAVFISTLAIEVLHHAQEKTSAGNHETEAGQLTHYRRECTLLSRAVIKDPPCLLSLCK